MSNAIPLIENSPQFLGNIRVRLKDRILLFRYLVIINLILGAWYLNWRVANSINFNALWLAIPLLVAEIYSYIGGVMFLTGLWQPVIRDVVSFHQMLPPLDRQEWPFVDVFITCYNEPVEMVEATARAALAMDYPASKLRVYVLDDGGSPEMQAMTEQLCIEDLKSAKPQQEAERINQERQQMVARLEHLKLLSAETPNAERALQHFHLQVSSQPEALAEVMRWFESLQRPEIPQCTWIEFQTILGEAFDNAIAHAHKNLPPKTPVDLEITILSHALILQIWDSGPGFDYETHIRQLSDQKSLTAESGRGTRIMLDLGDSFTYTRTADERNSFLAIKFYLAEFNGLSCSQHTLTGYLQSLLQSTLLLQDKFSSVSQYLNAEIQILEKSIYHKQLELSDLARCRYIARPKPKDRPHHAKAGNINYAIFSGETFGDFILTLDADHVPKPQFLQRVLPHFYHYNVYAGRYENNQVAFVQTPQSFSNLPPGDPFGHQAQLFYGPIQQGKDGMNSAFYTGTNALLRREALVSVGLQNFADEFADNLDRLEEFELVGGVSTASITEDMNTAMRLHAAGWKSAYHHEVLAVGLAPDDLSSTLQQRLRWAQGTIQVMLKEHPFMKDGLSFGQQLQYFQTMYSYFSGFLTLIFLLCPIIFFFTDIAPVSSYGMGFATHFLPMFITNRLTFLSVTWGIPARELWRSEQFAIALFPLFIQSVVSVFTGKPLKFKVTPKQRQSGIYLKLVWPQVAIVVLNVLGMLWCLYRAATGQLDDYAIYLINAAWSVYNISLLWSIIYAAVWRPKESV
jgi:cellulose synthase (UDP-forming)